MLERRAPQSKHPLFPTMSNRTVISVENDGAPFVPGDVLSGTAYCYTDHIGHRVKREGLRLQLECVAICHYYYYVDGGNNTGWRHCTHEEAFTSGPPVHLVSPDAEVARRSPQDDWMEDGDKVEKKEHERQQHSEYWAKFELMVPSGGPSSYKQSRSLAAKARHHSWLEIQWRVRHEWVRLDVANNEEWKFAGSKQVSVVAHDARYIAISVQFRQAQEKQASGVSCRIDQAVLVHGGSMMINARLLRPAREVRLTLKLVQLARGDPKRTEARKNNKSSQVVHKCVYAQTTLEQQLEFRLPQAIAANLPMPVFRVYSVVRYVLQVEFVFAVRDRVKLKFSVLALPEPLPDQDQMGGKKTKVVAPLRRSRSALSLVSQRAAKTERSAPSLLVRHLSEEAKSDEEWKTSTEDEGDCDPSLPGINGEEESVAMAQMIKLFQDQSLRIDKLEKRVLYLERKVNQ